MEQRNSGEWSQRPVRPNASSSSLSRMSTISDITIIDGFSDNVLESPTALRRQPSLVSLASESPHGEARPRADSEVSSIHTPSDTPSRWPSLSGYRMGGGYQQVSGAAGDSPSPSASPVPVPSRSNSRAFRPVMTRRRTETIPEEAEGIDLGLIRGAAPMGEADVGEAQPLSPAQEPVFFDVTSFWGPEHKPDEALLKRVQEHEANGQLTGGIGQGILTDTKITESELLATSPTAERPPLGRSFSRRLSLRRPSVGRNTSVRQLAQTEANKRGEVIEVILEEGESESQPHASEVDLSVMSGSTSYAPSGPGMRQSSFPVSLKAEEGKTEIFYPQPDWKPFSMRWPYLMAMIILTIGLGGGQEVLYQMSARQPLIAFHLPSDIPGGQYFAIKFAPTLITVTFGVLWQITDFEVKRLEAFYQLSKETGALADESINVDYITYFSFFRPIRAFQYKHYAVAVSSIISILANAVVPTLGAAAIQLTPDRNTRMEDPLGEKQIIVNGTWSRFLSVVLFIIAALGCVLFYQLQSRRTGLQNDVKGIGGLAAMAVVSHIMTDFKDMDVATHKLIHDRLKDHRYILRNMSLAPDNENPVTKQEIERHNKNHLSENSHPLMLRAKGAVPFIVGIVLFLGFIPVLLFTQAAVIGDKAPWIITALAVCIKLSWGSLETDVRMMEPYYILSRRHAPPKTLTLDYTAMPFGWVAIRAALNRHFLVFVVSFGTIMTEILTVLVTSLATVEGRDFIELINNDDDDGDGVMEDGDPNGSDDINAGQETVSSFWLSLGLVIFILVYMGIVATVVFIRRRRVFLPRQPNTIASVLAFIHQSKMLYDFVGTSKLSNAEMVARLEGIGKTYGLGWFQGRDGQDHCGVDQEELMSNYKLGYDYTQAKNPWEAEPVNWL